MIALKNLKIDIGTIIHVEHDKVATHVYKSNHDCCYNQNLVKDGIRHVYIEKFEDLEATIAMRISELGRIDVITGGPPCVDYSGLNAFREGTKGEQGQLMVRFGELVSKINKILLSKRLPPVFFLAENTRLGNDRELPLAEGDLERIKKAFSVDWASNFDSRLVSPLRRNRTYISNIPLLLQPGDFKDPSPQRCFDGDFALPAHVFEPAMIAKAQTFLASSGRVDDERMLVFSTAKSNRKDERIASRFISIIEREVRCFMFAKHIFFLADFHACAFLCKAVDGNP